MLKLTSQRVHEKRSYNIPQFPADTHFNAAISSLPTKDYIIHLAQVAHFHLNTCFFFFNHDEFLLTLNEVFPHNLERVSTIFIARLLLIVALGKMFLEKGASSSGPPGIREFIQGANLFPPALAIGREPVMAMETLCLLAFYAQASHIHDAAYLFVSHLSGSLSLQADVW
jgi:hypothetical protein